MDERWYLSVTYDDAKACIRNNLQNIARDYIALGYYLRVVQAGELYREDNYRNIHEFALEEYGLARSTVNHCMRINAEFSENGNSPIVEKRYREFSKSQLQEMLYIPEELRDDVKSDMTVKEIRALDEKRLDVEPEQELKPYEKHGCITGWSRYPEFCSCCGYDGVECCSQCDEFKNKHCNSRCGWIDNPYVPENISEVEESAESCPEEDEIPEQQITDDCQEIMPGAKAYETVDGSAEKDIEDVAGAEKDIEDVAGAETVMDCAENASSSEKSDYELIREQWHTAEVKLSKLLTSCTDEDIKVRKQKMLVMALAGHMYEYEQEVARESSQPELPNFRNNDQRKEWLRNYKDWGLWYEDRHIGCRFYKYDFENGARLIAEVYNVPKTSWYDEHDNAYLHLVGGPEPPKKGGCVCKWQRHETYDRFPNSETELVEFLKYVQKEG